MKDTDIVKDFKKSIGQYNFDSNKIDLACDISLGAHKGQFRLSGKPYIIHPVEIALNIAELYQDQDMVLAGLLHDCVEDSEDISMDMIYEKFGDSIGFIVDSVTKTTNFYYNNPSMEFNDKIDKLLYGGINDIKCLCLKIIDRKHNLVTLERMKKHKQIRMAFETQAIYEPLKDILKCYKKYDINKRAKLLKVYMKKNNINNFGDLKKSLYQKVFKNFDEETFSLVYENSDYIIWKIEDYNMYKELIEIPDFDKNIEVVDMGMSIDGKFQCKFRFKKGQVLNNFKSKFEVRDTYFIQ